MSWEASRLGLILVAGTRRELPPLHRSRAFSLSLSELAFRNGEILRNGHMQRLTTQAPLPRAHHRCVAKVDLQQATPRADAADRGILTLLRQSNTFCTFSSRLLCTPHRGPEIGARRSALCARFFFYLSPTPTPTFSSVPRSSTYAVSAPRGFTYWPGSSLKSLKSSQEPSSPVPSSTNSKSSVL